MLCRLRIHFRLAFVRSLWFQFVVKSCYGKSGLLKAPEPVTALCLVSSGSSIHIKACVSYICLPGLISIGIFM